MLEYLSAMALCFASRLAGRRNAEDHLKSVAAKDNIHAPEFDLHHVSHRRERLL